MFWFLEKVLFVKESFNGFFKNLNRFIKQKVGRLKKLKKSGNRKVICEKLLLFLFISKENNGSSNRLPGNGKHISRKQA